LARHGWYRGIAVSVAVLVSVWVAVTSYRTRTSKNDISRIAKTVVVPAIASSLHAAASTGPPWPLHWSEHVACDERAVSYVDDLETTPLHVCHAIPLYAIKVLPGLLNCHPFYTSDVHAQLLSLSGTLYVIAAAAPYAIAFVHACAAIAATFQSAPHAPIELANRRRHDTAGRPGARQWRGAASLGHQPGRLPVRGARLL